MAPLCLRSSVKCVVLTLLLCCPITDAVVNVRGVVGNVTFADYVVIFQRNASSESKDRHVLKYKSLTELDTESLFRHRFSIVGFEGYAARLTENLLL